MTTEIDYTKETETFIQRLNGGEFIFTSKATELTYTYDPLPNDTPMDRFQKNMCLADCLNNAIRAYIAQKESKIKTSPLYPDPHYKSDQSARRCYDWIRITWLTGSLQEGPGSTKKLEECRSENIRLQNELADLSAKYLEKERLLEGFETKYGLDKEGKRS